MAGVERTLVRSTPAVDGGWTAGLQPDCVLRARRKAP